MQRPQRRTGSAGLCLVQWVSVEGSREMALSPSARLHVDVESIGDVDTRGRLKQSGSRCAWGFLTVSRAGAAVSTPRAAHRAARAPCAQCAVLCASSPPFLPTSNNLDPPKQQQQRSLGQALAAAPSADVHEALARAHIKGEAYLEAAEAALKALTLDPAMAKAHLRRGCAATSPACLLAVFWCEGVYVRVSISLRSGYSQ